MIENQCKVANSVPVKYGLKIRESCCLRIFRCYSRKQFKIIIFFGGAHEQKTVSWEQIADILIEDFTKKDYKRTKK